MHQLSLWAKLWPPAEWRKRGLRGMGWTAAQRMDRRTGFGAGRGGGERRRSGTERLRVVAQRAERANEVIGGAASAQADMRAAVAAKQPRRPTPARGQDRPACGGGATDFSVADPAAADSLVLLHAVVTPTWTWWASMHSWMVAAQPTSRLQIQLRILASQSFGSSRV